MANTVSIDCINEAVGNPTACYVIVRAQRTRVNWRENAVIDRLVFVLSLHGSLPGLTRSLGVESVRSYRLPSVHAGYNTLC